MDHETLIKRGVSEEILTQDQGAKLLKLAHENGASPAQTSADLSASSDASLGSEGSERFQFSTNLSDLFIAAGLALFLSMLSAVINHFVGGSSPWFGFAEESATAAVIIIAITWAVAEYVSGKRGLTLPSIVILGFLIFDFYDLGEAIDLSDHIDKTSYAFSVILFTSLLFFARFRFPFALFPIALSAIFLAASAYVDITQGEAFTIFDEAQYDVGLICWLVFWGLVTFAAAMHFDLKDPLRRSNDKDRAFWLHLVASPILVQVVSIKLISEGGLSSLALMLYLLSYTLVALVIDRRAGVLSAIFYLAASLTYSQVSGDPVGASYFSSAILPTFLAASTALIVSLFWTNIRHFLLYRLPGDDWKKRLPPTQVQKSA